MSAKVSLPKEHGGIVTLGGSALLAGLVAPAPLASLAASVAIAASYMARGPIERAIGGASWRKFDGLALLAWVVVAAAAIAAVGLPLGWPALGITLLTPAGGAAARKLRKHRSVTVEIAGMGVFGLAAGATAYAGETSTPMAITTAVALAGYGASSAALVRAEVRRLPAAVVQRLSWLGVCLLACGATATAVITPAVALAYLPRGAHGLWRALHGLPSPTLPVTRVAVRECTELALFVGLVAWLVIRAG